MVGGGAVEGCGLSPPGLESFCSPPEVSYKDV